MLLKKLFLAGMFFGGLVACGSEESPEAPLVFITPQVDIRAGSSTSNTTLTAMSGTYGSTCTFFTGSWNLTNLQFVQNDLNCTLNVTSLTLNNGSTNDVYTGTFTVQTTGYATIPGTFTNSSSGNILYLNGQIVFSQSVNPGDTVTTSFFYSNNISETPGSTLPSSFLPRVATAETDTCVLRYGAGLATGGVTCTGRNQYGLLSGSSSSSSLIAAGSPLVATDVQNFTLGRFSACALTTLTGTNALPCWGAVATTPTSTLPMSSTPLSLPVCQSVVYTTGNTASTCAATAGPAFTPPLRQVVVGTSDTTGLQSACFLDANQKVFCWGMNNYGQLGAGFAQNFSVANANRLYQPTALIWTSSTGSSTTTGQFTSPSLGLAVGRSHTCSIAPGATSATNTVQCVGRNNVTQLGAGFVGSATSCVLSTNTTEQAAASSGSFCTKSQVVKTAASTNLTGIVQIASSLDGTCAVNTTGELWCWGNTGATTYRSGNGNPAIATRYARKVSTTSTGTAVTFSTNPNMFAMNANTVCAVTSTQQQLYCWGRVLGGTSTTVFSGNANTNPQPATLAYTLVGTTGKIFGVTLADVSSSTTTADGVGHVCIVRETGGVYCSGSNKYGQLGLGNITPNPDRYLFQPWSTTSGNGNFQLMLFP